MTDENKVPIPAEPVEVAPDPTKVAAPVEFDPNEVEKSEDDGTTRADGIDAEDKVVEK